MMVNKKESELCNLRHFLIDKPIEYFFKYFPSRIRNVGEDAVNARELIWAFKDAEADAFEEVAQIVAEHLIEKFGEKRLMNMSFVCVPPSSKEAYANRYFNFCNRVEELTGIGNGFSHVSLLKSRKASHEHKRGKTNYMVNKKFIISYMAEYDARWPSPFVRLRLNGNRGRIEDICKALCFLTGVDYNNIESLSNFVGGNQLAWGCWFDWGFFRCRAYKKGTMHFEFKDEKVWMMLNQEVAKQRGWCLPKKTKSQKRTA